MQLLTLDRSRRVRATARKRHKSSKRWSGHNLASTSMLSDAESSSEARPAQVNYLLTGVIMGIVDGGNELVGVWEARRNGGREHRSQTKYMLLIGLSDLRHNKNNLAFTLLTGVIMQIVDGGNELVGVEREGTEGVSTGAKY